MGKNTTLQKGKKEKTRMATLWLNLEVVKVGKNEFIYFRMSSASILEYSNEMSHL